MSIEELRQKTLKYIEENNITQIGLCKKLDIPQASLCKFLRGTRFKVADIHKIKLEQLLETETEYKPIVVNDTPIIKRDMEKVDINEVEDVVDALLQGETIHVENSNHTLRLNKGFITRYSQAGKVISVNSPVLMDEFYYILQPRKIKIELGGRYLTEHKEEVFIFKVVDGKFYGVCKGHDMYYKFMPDGTGCDFDDLIQEV